MSTSRADCLELFRDAIQRFGIPRKTRCDKGGENLGVIEEMIRLHPADNRPAMTGKSTQNTRIERLWWDYNTKVVWRFRYIFQKLENQGFLASRRNDSKMREVDHCCLHRVFLARIQRVADNFIASWDYHPLRTEHNKTPLRLWNEGWNDSSPPDLVDYNENYASEQEAREDDPDDSNQVVVEDPRIPNFDLEVFENWARESGVDDDGNDEDAANAYVRLRDRMAGALGQDASDSL